MKGSSTDVPQKARFLRFLWNLSMKKETQSQLQTKTLPSLSHLISFCPQEHSHTPSKEVDVALNEKLIFQSILWSCSVLWDCTDLISSGFLSCQVPSSIPIIWDFIHLFLPLPLFILLSYLPFFCLSICPSICHLSTIHPARCYWTPAMLGVGNRMVNMTGMLSACPHGTYIPYKQYRVMWKRFSKWFWAANC